MTENNAALDLGTSSGGRAYIADYFATQLRRHDFAKYINSTLAADFACALAQHLSKMRAEGVLAGEPVTDAQEAFATWWNSQDEGSIQFDLEQYPQDLKGTLNNLWNTAWRAALASASVSGDGTGTCLPPAHSTLEREAPAIAPVAGNASPDIMSLSGILAEYRKGCSNTGGEGPENCPDCVRAFVSALEALNVRQASAPGADGESQPIALTDEVIAKAWINVSDSYGIAYSGPLYANAAPQANETVTVEMIQAGAKAARECFERTGGNDPAAIYRAMRAAVPAAPPWRPNDDGQASWADFIAWHKRHFGKFNPVCPSHNDRLIGSQAGTNSARSRLDNQTPPPSNGRTEALHG